MELFQPADQFLVVQLDGLIHQGDAGPHLPHGFHQIIERGADRRVLLDLDAAVPVRKKPQHDQADDNRPASAR